MNWAIEMGFIVCARTCWGRRRSTSPTKSGAVAPWLPSSLSEGERITAVGLQEHLRHFVADGVIASWAVPTTAFVKELPKTSVGKFDEQVLRSRYPAALADWLRANPAVARPGWGKCRCPAR